MQYKCQPVFKYSLLFLVVYMFFMHQKALPPNKMLSNAFLITAIIVLFDYIVIKDHPTPFVQTNETAETAEKMESESKNSRHRHKKDENDDLSIASELGIDEDQIQEDDEYEQEDDEYEMQSSRRSRRSRR